MNRKVVAQLLDLNKQNLAHATRRMYIAQEELREITVEMHRYEGAVAVLEAIASLPDGDGIGSTEPVDIDMGMGTDMGLDGG